MIQKDIYIQVTNREEEKKEEEKEKEKKEENEREKEEEKKKEKENKEENKEKNENDEEKEKEEEEEKNSFLTIEKKTKLINILDKIKKELIDEKGSLKKVYEKYLPEEEDFQKKKIDKSLKDSCQLYLSFYFLGPMFSIFNLIGIYESMEIMKSLFEEIKQQIIIFINKRIFDKNKKFFRFLHKSKF